MANVIRHQKFVSVDTGYASKSDNENLKGSNKVWECLVYDNGDFEVIYGKVGGTMAHDVKPLGSVAAANSYADKKIVEKKKSKTDKATGMVTCYEEVTTVDTAGFQPAAKAAKGDLSRIAKKQISYSNPIVADLIDRLAKANIHDIVAATGGKMSYNDTTGLFSTPLGVVTQDTIDDARNVLVEIGDFVVAGDYGNDAFFKAVDRYLRRIPTDTGYGRLDLKQLLPDLGAVQRQNSVLDSLEASLKMALAPSPTDGKPVVADEPKLFEVELSLIEDGKEIDRLRKLYRDTLRRGHQCSHLDVKRVFSVDIKNMREAFEPVAARLGNVQFLYHGTRTCHLISILKQGLVIPPASSPHLTGSMFGRGCYFANSSSKSLNYSYGYWSGGRDENCFMFMADVALGRAFTPLGPRQNLPEPGYDSTHAVAGRSGVQNDEIIVYKVSQCNLRYLMEFTPGGK